jgi:heat shock protein HslJ
MFCTEEAKMLERYQLYENMKDSAAPTIMTDTMTPEKIRDEIIRIINS